MQAYVSVACFQVSFLQLKPLWQSYKIRIKAFDIDFYWEP